jgi:Flp pilus assembly pilin Flp
MLRRTSTNRRRGVTMVEYAVVAASVILAATTAISVFGSKVADVIAVTAGVVPGANPEKNAPISTGNLMPTQLHHGNIEMNASAMVKNGGISRYESVFGHTSAGAFVATPSNHQ